MEQFHHRRFLLDLRAAVTEALADDALSGPREAVLEDRLLLYDLLLADGGPGGDVDYERLLEHVLTGEAALELLNISSQWAVLMEARRLLTFMQRKVRGDYDSVAR